MNTLFRRPLYGSIVLTAVAATAAVSPPPSPPSETPPTEPIITLEKFVTVEYTQTEDTGKGFGESRATVSLPSVDIAVMPPGQNPIILLGKTPGVNVTTSDNIGL